MGMRLRSVPRRLPGLRRVQRCVLMLGLTGIAFFGGVALSTVGVAAAGNNTPSLGNGDCWRPTTATTCRVTWTGLNSPVYFRAIDQFSGQQPSWSAPIDRAVLAWNGAPGPQYYSFTPTSNDTWIYINASITGQHDLASNELGVDWNCNVNKYCSDQAQAMNILWSDVYLNQSTLAGASAAIIQNTAAHESGHAMGLNENTTDSSSVMWPYESTVLGPNSNDIGNYPGCSSSGHGVNCIYGWGN